MYTVPFFLLVQSLSSNPIVPPRKSGRSCLGWTGTDDDTLLLYARMQRPLALALPRMLLGCLLLCADATRRCAVMLCLTSQATIKRVTGDDGDSKEDEALGYFRCVHRRLLLWHAACAMRPSAMMFDAQDRGDTLFAIPLLSPWRPLPASGSLSVA